MHACIAKLHRLSLHNMDRPDQLDRGLRLRIMLESPTADRDSIGERCPAQASRGVAHTAAGYLFDPFGDRTPTNRQGKNFLTQPAEQFSVSSRRIVQRIAR